MPVLQVAGRQLVQHVVQRHLGLLLQRADLGRRVVLLQVPLGARYRLLVVLRPGARLELAYTAHVGTTSGAAECLQLEFGARRLGWPFCAQALRVLRPRHNTSPGIERKAMVRPRHNTSPGIERKAMDSIHEALICLRH